MASWKWVFSYNTHTQTHIQAYLCSHPYKTTHWYMLIKARSPSRHEKVNYCCGGTLQPRVVQVWFISAYLVFVGLLPASGKVNKSLCVWYHHQHRLHLTDQASATRGWYSENTFSILKFAQVSQQKHCKISVYSTWYRWMISGAIQFLYLQNTDGKNTKTMVG